MEMLFWTFNLDGYCSTASGCQSVNWRVSLAKHDVLMLSLTSVQLHRSPRLEALSGTSFDPFDPAPGGRNAIKELEHYVPNIKLGLNT